MVTVDQWNSLIQQTIGFVFTLITLTLQLRMLYYNISERQVSNTLRLSMVTWSFASALNIFYTGHFLFFFRGENTMYRAIVISWTGTCYFSSLTTVSLSVFFLLLDRCLILTFSTAYTGRKRQIFEVVCMLTVIFEYVFVLFRAVGLGFPNLEFTPCMSIGCLPKSTHTQLTIAMKLLFGSLNTITAAVFAIIFYNYNKLHEHKTARRANIAAGFSVLSELTFSVMPNILTYIVYWLFQIQITQKLGPVLTTFSVTEGLLTAFCYWRIFEKRGQNSWSTPVRTQTVTSRV